MIFRTTHLITLVSLICILYVQPCVTLVQQLLGNVLINTADNLQLITSRATTWTPGLNGFFNGKTFLDLKHLCGVKADIFSRTPKTGYSAPADPQLKGKTTGGGGKRRKRRDTAVNLPDEFDWRKNSKCQSILDVRDQQCGDCWAVASAAAISDRYCIATGNNRFFSAKQIASCVYGSDGGCDGGYPEDAMKLYKESGVATGGDPTLSNEPVGCLPYPKNLYNTKQCPSACASGMYLDALKGADYRTITSKNVQDIQKEIYKYGPVVTIMETFGDLTYYKSGVYKKAYGDSAGWHAIRLLGWGTKNGVAYWLAANQWGTDWGEKGFFKILRGQNHCGVETWVSSAYPKESWK